MGNSDENGVIISHYQDNTLVYKAKVTSKSDSKNNSKAETEIQVIVDAGKNLVDKAGHAENGPIAIVAGTVVLEAIPAVLTIFESDEPSAGQRAQEISILNPADTNLANYGKGEQMKPRRYKAELKNLFGFDVVNVEYEVTCNYNAQYIGRNKDVIQGSYIPHLGVKITHQDVSVGCGLKVECSIRKLVNIGSNKWVNPSLELVVAITMEATTHMLVLEDFMTVIGAEGVVGQAQRVVLNSKERIIKNV